MKKVLMFAIAAALLFAFTVPGYSWTGRMAGMGNPYGLVEDESDFLTHPTAITQGKGWQFYGDFGLDYTKTTAWDLSRTYYPTGYRYAFSGNGTEWANTASFGFTFPVNTGRMGFFIDYAGNFIGRDKTTGNFDMLVGSSPFYGSFDVRRDYDFFRLRAMYAQPFTNNVKFGGEFGISYKTDKRESSFSGYWVNGPAFIYSGVNDPTSGWNENLFAYGIPYDSKYWETSLKATVEGTFGASKLNVSVFGGFIFSGKDAYSYTLGQNVSIGPGPWTTPGTVYDMDGDVSGWNIGAEAWWRFAITKSLSLPFVVRADYREKARKGDAALWNYDGTATVNHNYDYTEKSLNILAGGGVDYRISKACGIAVGLYYNYLKEKQNFTYNEFTSWGLWDTWSYSGYPNATEHRILLRAAGEFGLTPNIALTTGLGIFYGWVKQDFGRYYNYPPYSYYSSPMSLDGHRWGINASIGAVFGFGSFTFEPYLRGGYQKLDTSGDGYSLSYSSPYTSSDDIKKTQWNVGGGFAIKFN